jgi:F420-non-reducing hydrogenase iron-sulfur subunit
MMQLDRDNGMERKQAAWTPDIIAFCCNYCGFAAADLAGIQRIQYSAGVRIIHAPCTGKLEMEHILEAFEKGADGILVVGCLEGGCHYVEGNLRARRRIERIRSILEEIGLGSERLKMVNLSDSMAPEFVRYVQEIASAVTALGANPLKRFEQTESAGE